MYLHDLTIEPRSMLDGTIPWLRSSILIRTKAWGPKSEGAGVEYRLQVTRIIHGKLKTPANRAEISTSYNCTSVRSALDVGLRKLQNVAERLSSLTTVSRRIPKELESHRATNGTLRLLGNRVASIPHKQTLC